MTEPLDHDSPTPLWAQLVERLRERATAGEFAAGFPSEPRLVSEYGVSRHTVREALRRLRDAGAVTSVRGRGSHATQARFRQPVGALYSLFATIEATGVAQRSEVRELAVTADAEAAGRLGLTPDAALIVLRRVRLAAEEPLAVDTAWLPAELARPLLEVDFAHTALYHELARHCGIRVDGGSETITPVVPDAQTRRTLRMPPQAAAFRLQRQGTAAGRTVEWRTTLIRGDRYRLTADWSPTRAQRVSLTPTDTTPP